MASYEDIPSTELNRSTRVFRATGALDEQGYRALDELVPQPDDVSVEDRILGLPLKEQDEILNAIEAGENNG